MRSTAVVALAALLTALLAGLATAGSAPGSPAARAPSGPAPAAPAPEPSWKELNHAAKVAHDAKDFQGYRERVGRLFELLSGHPDTVFGMARAEALLGHTAAALDWLNAFAGMGLVRDAASDPDLVSLRKADGFAAVLARIEANRRPVSRAARAFTLPDPDLLTEDIAYDPSARRFFVSSIRQGKIVAIDERSGAAADFVPAGRDGTWGMLALAVDARR